MNTFEVKAKLDIECNTSMNESVKHFERMKELLQELVNEMNQIQYGSQIKAVELIAPKKTSKDSV